MNPVQKIEHAIHMMQEIKRVTESFLLNQEELEKERKKREEMKVRYINIHKYFSESTMDDLKSTFEDYGVCFDETFKNLEGKIIQETPDSREVSLLERELEDFIRQFSAKNNFTERYMDRMF